MTSFSSTVHLIAPAPLPAVEAIKKENNGLPLQQTEKENALVIPMVKKVNDPAQWDEAWFANYE
jgi:hypothetical protein